MNLWTPPRDWEGQAAYLIGGGPSLKDFPFELLKGKNVIGCNDAMHLGPEICSYVVFGDPTWWQTNKWKLESYKGQIVTNSPTLLNYNLPNIHTMERERDGIHSGYVLGWNYSTGAAAINLAVSLGATEIYLLGYDLNQSNGQSHWHQHNQKPIADYAFKRFEDGFDMVRRCLPNGVKVFNVTDGTSKLRLFEEVPLRDFADSLKGLEVLVNECH